MSWGETSRAGCRGLALGLALIGMPLSCASSPRVVARTQEGALYDPEGWAAALEESDGRSYWRDRRDQWMDAVSARFVLGPGLGARVRATHWLQAGWIYSGPVDAHDQILGLDTLQFGTSGREVGSWAVRSVEYGIYPFYVHDQDVALRGEPPAQWYSTYEDRSASSFGAQIHLALVGADLSFDPIAFGRFLLGWFGLSRPEPSPR